MRRIEPAVIVSILAGTYLLICIILAIVHGRFM